MENEILSIGEGEILVGSYDHSDYGQRERSVLFGKV